MENAILTILAPIVLISLLLVGELLAKVFKWN